jgi:hypothetical protein
LKKFHDLAVLIVLRPYLKFLIAGGVLSGEGGSVLVSGLELLWTTPLMNSLSSMVSYMPPMGSMIAWEGIGYIIAGIVSLIIGLPLLFTGVSRRKQWLASHAQESAQGIARPGGWQNEPAKEQPYLPDARAPSFEPITTREQVPRGSAAKKYCTFCGDALPASTDMLYCPSCGHRI